MKHSIHILLDSNLFTNICKVMENAKGDMHKTAESTDKKVYLFMHLLLNKNFLYCLRNGYQLNILFCALYNILYHVIRHFQNYNTEYLPTKCRITKPPPPKPAANPLQFVKVAPCPLFQKAQEQIKKADEIKGCRMEIREGPEEWQQVIYTITNFCEICL